MHKQGLKTIVSSQIKNLYSSFTIIEMWQNKMASYLLPVEETRGVTQKLEKKVSKELITEDGYCKTLQT